MADENAIEHEDEDDSAESRSDHDIALLKSHTLQLFEHFDSVQIFVTRAHSEGTTCVDRGEGNWFARYGQVHEWLVKQDAKSRKEATE